MATIVKDSWAAAGISVNPNAVSTKTFCPSCSDTRKNKRDKSLSVNAVKGVANCHNCGDNFVIRPEGYKSQQKEYKMPEVKQLPVSENVLNFFKTRGIEPRVVEYFKITESKEWMYEGKENPEKGVPAFKEGVTSCINFNYFDDKKLVNVKFRAKGKRFKLSPGSKLIFYNLDAIKNSDECSIQEGEVDTMSAYQCNIFNCVSVPNGASKGNQRLEYLDNCIEYFLNKKKIILATDGDEAGLMLRNELMRRLGRDVCWVIDYPEGCKDTNEVLLKHGPEAVREMYANAYQLPIEGIVEGNELEREILDIYENGYPKGVGIGYPEFDKNIGWIEGQLTLWTGIPGSGKSEFIDQVLVRLSSRHGWRHAIFAPENEPRFQAAAMISKFIGGKMVGDDKISEMKRDKGIQFIKDHFFFMKVDEIDVTIDGILGLAKELILKKGINLLLIDPYNYIEHRIPQGYSETQYISELLTKIVTFGKINNVAIFLVAHPTKIQKDASGKYKVVTLYDISGSANFFNKTFNGISIYRDFEQKIVTTHIQKVKYKWIGHVGSNDFTYDYPTGRYAPIGEQFENELDVFLARESQTELTFEPSSPSEFMQPSRQLTDISKLIPGAYEPNF